MTESVWRLVKGLRNYRNPFSLMCQRAVKSRIVTVVDRKTGLRFRCRRGAEVMMAETLHAHIYDVAFAPLRWGDVVFDVGASHGYYACWAAYQGATVHAFEPDPDAFQLLVENIRVNRLDGKVTAHPEAIGGEGGEANLLRTPRLGGGMNTTVPAFAQNTRIDITAETKVKMLSLPEAMEKCQVKRLRVCKLDCEGAELSILGALAPATIEMIDAFVFEYHPEAYDVLLLIESLLGWKDYHISKVYTHDVENANLCAVRSDLLRQWCGGQNSIYRQQPTPLPVPSPTRVRR
jgi:FkbM family methyltransferase